MQKRGSLRTHTHTRGTSYLHTGTHQGPNTNMRHLFITPTPTPTINTNVTHTSHTHTHLHTHTRCMQMPYMNVRNVANLAWALASIGQLRDPDFSTIAPNTTYNAPSSTASSTSSSASGIERSGSYSIGSQGAGSSSWEHEGDDGAHQLRALMVVMAGFAGRALPSCNYADLAQFAGAFAMVCVCVYMRMVMRTRTRAIVHVL